MGLNNQQYELIEKFIKKRKFNDTVSLLFLLGYLVLFIYFAVQNPNVMIGVIFIVFILLWVLISRLSNSLALKALRRGDYELSVDTVDGKSRKKNNYYVRLENINDNVSCDRFVWMEVNKGSYVQVISMGNYRYCYGVGV